MDVKTSASQPRATASNRAKQMDAQMRGATAQSVRQLAKAAVATAQANGIALPKNALNLAVAQIAKGAHPAKIFAPAEPKAKATPPAEASIPKTPRPRPAPANLALITTAVGNYAEASDYISPA